MHDNEQGPEPQSDVALGDSATPTAVSQSGTPTDGARRQLLVLGAASVAAAVTVRPAFAQTAVSVLNCEIPVPDPARRSQYIAADGSVVAPGTAGSVPGMTRPFRGEDVRAALQGRTLPGTTYEQNQAYLNYIRRLRAGQNGFTCFASIQMPR